jgi:hypothetical protein
MRVIIIGCEYTGQTTLVNNLRDWIMEQMGEQRVMVHDHFMPRMGEARPDRTREEEEAELAGLAPFALEKYMRYMIHYHLGQHFYSDNDHLVVGWYLADAVYAPIYFGYGGPNQYADRKRMARHHDAEVNEIAPDTFLVYLTASPEVIRERMRAEPRPTSPFREEDIETVLDGFEDEYASAMFRRKIALDTTESTPEQTFQALLDYICPLFTSADTLRILNHRAVTGSNA